MDQPIDHEALNEAARRRLGQTPPPILQPGLHAAFVILAAISWAAITILSLLPGTERPHTGLSGNVEHFLAYALAAIATRLSLFGLSSRAQVLGFSLASAIFEIAQIWIPGRSAGVDNWLASTAGAALGALLARTIVHRSITRSVGV